MQRRGFKKNEYIVYPAYGVGQIVDIAEQEISGYNLELFIIVFSHDRLTLRVPVAKATDVGMRKISTNETVEKALQTVKGRAKIKRTMWSRRAQEYGFKINSGDIIALSEVIRDLHRDDTQPDQSYSERQLYELARDRMLREVAVVKKVSESDASVILEKRLNENRTSKKKSAGQDENPDIAKLALTGT